MSASKLSRLETGVRSVSAADLESLFSLYAIPPDKQVYLRQLSKTSRQTSEWQRLDSLDFNGAIYVELEQAASAIDDYKTSLVTALLQTPDYTQAIFSALAPNLPPEKIQEHVLGRRLRQQRMWEREKLPRLTFVLDEGALRRQIGGPSVMRAQLQHIVSVTDRAETSLHVVPFNSGAHPGMESVFTILSFQEAIRDKVYVDSLMGEHYFDNMADLDRYRLALARITALALDPVDSRKLIESIAATLDPT